ncbi:PREDICTED: SRA stem-loop-interacting RNA-binding protein, mitochondrial-like [Wasmannia auropunctata]|uniref:SRA stem-loop-interacting RNA-binding protein, mitochondrial-like n=1 Tax=Wasmannia auropunctata TaxID=64793 RepID=UPI0005EED590|nr:PREDICTED: SRA stem-loop-interacting RNA-binding protein, mitochondrial-like [Wasmannia auropunctata]
MNANVVRRPLIYVANIPWTVSRHELSLYFSQFGAVQDAFVAFDNLTGLHQGYGHVRFLKREDADNVFGRKHSLEGNDLVLSRD